MMKLGIISYSFEREAFEKIKQQGLDFVEFCVNAAKPDRYAEFGERARRLRKTSMNWAFSPDRWAAGPERKRFLTEA